MLLYEDMLWEVKRGIYFWVQVGARETKSKRNTKQQKCRDRNQREGGCENRGPQVLVKIGKKTLDIQGQGIFWNLS